MLTEADILAEVVQGDRNSISREVAGEILKLRFNDRSDSRIRELLSRNNAGMITADERGDLDKYLRVGLFIDLLQAKARLALKAAEAEQR